MDSAGWNNFSDRYSSDPYRLTSLFFKDMLYLSKLPPNQVILDLCCGPGDLGLQLALQGHKVISVDFSSSMIDKVAKKKQQLEHDGHSLDLTLLVNDGTILPDIPDATIDYVFSNFGLFLFPDRLKGWQSCYRVLKPGGKLLMSSWTFDELLNDLQNKSTSIPSIFTVNAAISLITKGNYHFAEQAKQGRFSLNRLQKELNEAQFKSSQAVICRHSICVESIESVFQYALDLNDELVVKHEQEIKENIKRMLRVGDGPFSIGDTAHVIKAIK